MNPVIDAVSQRLRAEEGLRLKPYRCPAGKLTIGYGRNIQEVGITKAEAEMLLQNDIQKTINDLNKSIPWYQTLSETRQVVLVDMCFNLGLTEFLKFKNTLYLVKNGDYVSASKAMLQSKWADQVGKRAVELSEMMKMG
jgi:lysozyme